MATKKSKKVAKKTVKRVATKASPKVVKKAKSASRSESFLIMKDRTPFMTYQVTQQTIYWGILFVYILILSLWILNIQLDTLRIIDKINSL